MSIPVPLRSDYDAVAVRRLARQSDDAAQTRRLLALGAIYAGSTRSEAAALGGVGVQIVRDWVVRFNAEGPDGLINKKAPGQPPKLKAVHRRALARMIEEGPIPAVHGVVRWRLVDLVQWVWEEFKITVSEPTLGRVLNAMDYTKLSARPRHHAQNPAAAADFKKASRRSWQRSRAAKRPARR